MDLQLVTEIILYFISYVNHFHDLEDTCFKQSSILCVEVQGLLYITTLEFDRHSQEFITSWHSCISCSKICVLPFLFPHLTSFILSHGEFLVGVLRHCCMCYLSYCELLLLFFSIYTWMLPCACFTFSINILMAFLVLKCSVSRAAGLRSEVPPFTTMHSLVNKRSLVVRMAA